MVAPLASKLVLATSLITLKVLLPMGATAFPIVVGFSGSAHVPPPKPRIKAEAGRVTVQESPLPFRVTRTPRVELSYFTSRLVEESSVREMLCPTLPPNRGPLRKARVRQIADTILVTIGMW
jgi:hypothetical protein